MAKPSAGARLFCVVFGLLMLALAAVGGYAARVNKRVVDLPREKPTPHALADLPDLPRPAHVRLQGVVAGKPVLVPLSKAPVNEKEKAKKLPPKMDVWVPLYADEADQKAGRVGAVYCMRAVPRSANATLPAHWDGLLADGAFGLLRQTPPAPLPADVPVITQPSHHLAAVFWVPAVVAGFIALCGLASFASIPWAGRETPKAAASTNRPRRPLRGLPADATHLATYARTAGGSVGAAMYFLLPGLLLVAMGAVFIVLMLRAKTMGESGGFLALMPVVGLALIIAGIVKSRGRSVRVSLFEEGVSWENGQGGVSAAWEDVAEVYRADERTTYEHVVSTREAQTRLVFCDGTELKFDPSLGDYDELSLAVISHTGELLRERKAEEWAAGEADFGPITLTPAGVRHSNGKVQAWGALVGYTLENGRFWFRTPGVNLLARTYEAKDVPNLAVLVEMLDGHFGRAG